MVIPNQGRENQTLSSCLKAETINKLSQIRFGTMERYVLLTLFYADKPIMLRPEDPITPSRSESLRRSIRKLARVGFLKSERHSYPVLIPRCFLIDGQGYMRDHWHRVGNSTTMTSMGRIITKAILNDLVDGTPIRWENVRNQLNQQIPQRNGQVKNEKVSIQTTY